MRCVENQHYLLQEEENHVTVAIHTQASFARLALNLVLQFLEAGILALDLLLFLLKFHDRGADFLFELSVQAAELEEVDISCRRLPLDLLALRHEEGLLALNDETADELLLLLEHALRLRRPPRNVRSRSPRLETER